MSTEASQPQQPKVLTAWSNGWRKLDSQAKGPDEETAQSSARFREDLLTLLNSEHLVVLAGLGTSIGLKSSDDSRSAPFMSDLWEGVAVDGVFDSAKPLLSEEIVKDENFEHMLSDAQARHALTKQGTREQQVLADFITNAEQVVWNKCNFVDEDSALTHHEAFLRKVARRSTRLQRTQIFTTNYDLAFETAARNIRFNVIDGFGFGSDYFDGGRFDLDFVRRRPNSAPTLEPNVLHLLKLHGSVNWNAADQIIKKVTDGSKPPKPALIYPSATKYQLSYQQPYLEFMSRFQIALRQPNVGLIVIGFGFNDEHLVAPVRAAIQSNVGLKMIVVDPGATSDTRSQTFSQIEALIKLGDRRLSMFEATFQDFLPFLPEIPDHDEHTLHVERAARVIQERQP